MASPLLNLICCQVTDGHKNKTHNLHSSDSHPNQDEMLTLGLIFFSGMLLGSLVGLIGTGLTLRPKRGTQRTRREAVADKRQRVILSWLTVSDLLGCVGGLVTAVYSFIEFTTFYDRQDSNPTSALICVVVTTWMQFFYLATFFWSFFYAIDVYLILMGYKGKFLFWIYFCLAWLVSAVLIGHNLYFIYHGQKGFHCKEDGRDNVTIIFIGSAAVHVMMFVGMPVIYCLSSKKLSPMLKQGGVYTNRERRVKIQIQKRFLKIVIIFMICWTPNMTEYVIEFVESRLDVQWWDTLILNATLMTLMATLNPMQAFFNALVYWGPAGCTQVQPSPEFTPHQDSQSFFIGQRSVVTSNGEQTPLLRDTGM